MKKTLIFITLAIFPMSFVWADDFELIKKAMQESDNLKKEVARLRSDSIVKSNELIQLRMRIDSAKLDILHAQDLKKQNKKLTEELKNARKDSTTIEQYQDTLVQLRTLQHNIENQKDSIATELSKSQIIITQYGPKLAQHQQIVKVLDKNYASATIDKLYKESSKEQLLLSKEIYMALNKNVPLVIQQTIECFEAKEQCLKKFNKTFVDMKRTPLLKHNSKTSKDLALLLQQYAIVYAGADSLWNAIKTEVCKEEIVEESFSQLQYKRQIWQRTQQFLGKYPNLAHDYPYIYEELQKMLREIWKNANNFNKIPAPFR